MTQAPGRPQQRSRTLPIQQRGLIRRGWRRLTPRGKRVVVLLLAGPPLFLMTLIPLLMYPDQLSSTEPNVPVTMTFVVAAFVVVLWFGRRIDSHLVLHGFLMGLVATLLYVALVTGSGQMPTALAAYGPATFVIVNAARLVGAVLGGVAGERRRATLA